MPTVQRAPSAHPGARAPPQSTSVSSPFVTPSLAVGSAQREAMHARETQSSATRHPRPTSHAGDAEPPQSTSVSSPFRTRSARGAAHSPPSHTRLAQSRPVRHARPSPHEGARVPPQSTADSSPFMTPSSDRGARHLPSTQTRSAQSRRVAHARPSPQRGPAIPPQSTSVSSPFVTPSSARAGAHAPSLVHTPEAHSEPLVHTTPRRGRADVTGLGSPSLGGSTTSGAREHATDIPTRTPTPIARRTMLLTRGVRGARASVARPRHERIFHNSFEHLQAHSASFSFLGPRWRAPRPAVRRRRHEHAECMRSGARELERASRDVVREAMRGLGGLRNASRRRAREDTIGPLAPVETCRSVRISSGLGASFQ